MIDYLIKPLNLSILHFLVIALLGVQVAFIPSVALAQEETGLGGSFNTVDEIERNAGVVEDRDIKGFIKEALKTVTGLAAIIAVAVLIWGGFMYITSAGDENKAKQAKMLVLYAVIGLILIGAAAVIVNFVIGIFDE